jgi:hypothetical protein
MLKNETLPDAVAGQLKRRVRPHATAAGYGCILADPPWALTMAGQRKRVKEAKKPKAVARDLNLALQTIYRWRKSWQSGT